MVGKIELSSGNCFPSIWLRCDANVDSERGYQLAIDRFGTLYIGRVPSGYSGTTVASQARTFTAGVVYGFRFRAIGGAIKARVWDSSGSEPSTWDLEYTDSSPLAANYAGITVANGTAANAYTWFDDIVLSSGQNTITIAGSVTTTGALLRGPFVKNPFTGSIAAVGIWSYIKVVQRVFTGTFSTALAGTVKRSVTKGFVGTLGTGLVGTSIRIPRKRLAGSVTATGFERNTLIRVFTGTISSVGAVTTALAGRVFGRPGLVKIVAEKAGEVRMRIRRG
jgi:hypothetical protein